MSVAVHNLMVVLLTPPAGAGVFWIMGNAWIHITEGANPSKRTRGWLKLGFWVLLVTLYAAMIIVLVTGYRYHPSQP